jgi:putative hydrolase of the HAD superfamily
MVRYPPGWWTWSFPYPRPVSIDAVIFDWGGTLTPWHTVDLAEEWRVYARVVAPDDADAVAARLISAGDRVWAAARVHQQSATLADLLATAGVPLDDDAAKALRDFWEPHTYTDPDVPELFAELRRRYIRIGVLSNTIWPRQWHEDVFSRDGVLPLLDGAVYTSEIAHTKPHPEAFRSAMAAVGVVDPTGCVFVGDRPYDDISGARAIGMRAVLVPHSEIPTSQQVPVDVEPDAVINRLADLLPYIDAWRDAA